MRGGGGNRVIGGMISVIGGGEEGLWVNYCVDCYYGYGVICMGVLGGGLCV